MKEEIQRRVVRIELPLVDGSYRYFSGYIIGDGTIITCRHGFADEGISDYKKDGSVEIVAQRYKSPIPLNGASNFSDLCNQGIILFESNQYDIVIFQDNNAKGHYSALSLSEWDELGEWEGGGYPSYNEDEEETKGYESLDGKASAVAIDGICLKLKTNKSLVEMKGWSSVSGSPIFPKGKTNLVGIVRNYDQEVNDQLEAVYLKRIWDEQEEFKEVLNKLQAQQLTPINKTKLEAFFEQEKNFAEKLAEHLKIPANQLLAKILSSNKRTIMDIGKDLKNEDKISTFLMLSFTCHYDDPKVFEESPTQNKPYTTVLCVGVVPCEFTMSAKSARDPIFTLTAAGKIQEGKYSITTPPESGINSTAEIDLAHELLNGSGDIHLVTNRLASDLKTRKNIADDKDKIINAAKRVLIRAKGKYYLQVEEVTPRNIKVLQAIYNMYQNDINIIELAKDEDFEIEDEENDVFDNLIPFIH